LGHLITTPLPQSLASEAIGLWWAEAQRALDRQCWRVAAGSDVNVMILLPAAFERLVQKGRDLVDLLIELLAREHVIAHGTQVNSIEWQLSPHICDAVIAVVPASLAGAA
jgi:hypothetical protein